MAGYGIQAIANGQSGAREHPTAQQLARMGRKGDDTIGHLESGELVIPKSVQSPGLVALVSKRMRQRGMNPERYKVGSDWASRNPSTGVQQFYDVGGSDESVAEGPGNNPGGGFSDSGGGGLADIDAQAAYSVAQAMDNQAAQNNAFGETQAGIASGWNSFALGVPSFIANNVFGYSQAPNPDDPTQVAHNVDPSAALGLAFGVPGTLAGLALNAMGVDMSFDVSQMEGITEGDAAGGSGGEGSDSAGGGKAAPGPVPAPAANAPVSAGAMAPTPALAQTAVPSIDYYRYGRGPEVLQYPWDLEAGRVFGQYPFNLGSE